MSNPTVAIPPLSPLGTFICGGLAGCTAVTVSNPAEVLKTRLQLDAELGKGKVYSGVLDVFTRTWKSEGIRGVQRGLMPAYAYQMLLNGSRLGFYEPLRGAFNHVVGAAPSQVLVGPAIAAGAASGLIGAMLGNPLFLVKTRMQAYSPNLPVGTQRQYKSVFDALRQIYRAEGLRGFCRGMDAAILRTGMGSSAQLPSYNYAKGKLSEYGLMSPDSMWTFIVSSAFSGLCVCIVMQPGDTTLTRMYNQPTERLPDGRTVGLLYKNPIDCLWKTLRAEGIFGWYKGTVAHFLRISPHTIVTLTANEVILSIYRKLRSPPSSLPATSTS